MSSAMRPWRYAFAVLAAGLALTLRWALHPVLEDRLPYLLCFLAAVLVAFYQGSRPSLVTLGLGLLAGSFLFVNREKFVEADLD